MDLEDEVAPPTSPSDVAPAVATEKEKPEVIVGISELEQKLADEMRLRMYTEQVLDLRQQELEERDADKRQLEAQVEALKKALTATQQQLVDVQDSNKVKTKQLSDAREHIFSLQPAQKDITEAEAIEGYKQLCVSVHRWAESRMGPMLNDFDRGRIRSRPTQSQAGRFVSLIRDGGKRCLTVGQADEYHVVAIIMHYLYLLFFTKQFYCPLDDLEGDATLSWINDIEASMSRLPRDVAQCRAWRSETITSLTSLQSFKSRRTRYLKLASEDLASLLSIVVPAATSTELQGSLRRVIIEPAADLVHRFHLASNIYTLKWPARGAWSRLEVYECTNIATGGESLDLSGTTPASPARRKVSYLFDIAPGLFVERISSGKKQAAKAICKPNVLVYGGNEELVQQPTLMRWIWDVAAGTATYAQDPMARTGTPANTPAQVRRW